MGARFEVPQQRLEELAQLLELIHLHKRAGIEHQRLEFGPVTGNPGTAARYFAAVAVDGIGQPLGEAADLRGQGPTAQQQGALDRPQASGLPAFQTRRCRQAKRADQTLADRRVGEVDITVRHGTLSGDRGSKVDRKGLAVVRFSKKGPTLLSAVSFE